MHLLPVMKVQFERYLAEPGTPGDAWYETVLATNPRCSYRTVQPDTRERLILTGILPAEAEQFAHWLGPEYRLPTVEEWRTAYGVLRSCHGWFRELEVLLERTASPVARAVYAALRVDREPGSLAQVALMEEGVLEWVRDARGWGGFGLPRPSLYEVICDPLTCPPIVPQRMTDRLGFFGFRAVRQG